MRLDTARTAKAQPARRPTINSDGDAGLSTFGDFMTTPLAILFVIAYLAAACWLLAKDRKQRREPDEDEEV